MIVLPAIDLMGGKAVRLIKGDYSRRTVYNEDPVAQAKEFRKAGAMYLHVVDLDGAKSGAEENAEVIGKIVSNTSLKVEVGGGIRSVEAIDRYLALGVERVILGTIAIEDTEFLKAAIERYGEHIAVGVDVLEGEVRTRGWTKGSGRNIYDFMNELTEKGVKTVVCTDISRDGMMEGTNVSLYKKLSEEFRTIDIIASGGVSSMEDILRLKKDRIKGAIIGKALYTGAIDLREAIRAAGEEEDDN
jgi:phosphoribosylformimino-5-aminoimidazole carboxamide ribotide isomerase